MQAEGGCLSTIIAGLDPAIHDAIPLLRPFIMDTRVKPGHDTE
jgi:hypothetical protein